MKIVDLRPPVERWAQSVWRGEPTAHPGYWSRFMGGIVARRLAGREAPAASPFILSIGNLSLGGSGKTPVAGKLALDLARAGLKTGLLTRGYRSRRKGPVLVDAGCDEYGDEARLLARMLAVTGVPVVQAADRAAGLNFLTAEFPDLDCVVVEDGFQTRGVGRHLDVLILDAWDFDARGLCRPLAGPVVPQGPWREPAAAAGRAGIWLLESSLAPMLQGPPGHEVTAFSRTCRLVSAADGQERNSLARPWAALAGIARPEALERDAGALAGTPPVAAVRCRDHEPYTPARIREIARHLDAAGADSVVTTEKDWIKLEGRVPSSWRVYLVVQAVHWTAQGDALPELVRKRVARHAEGVRD